MRSLATRDAGQRDLGRRSPDAIAACKAAGFDLVIVETSGIGQGDAAIVPLVDVSLYVMTPEFGAASQLEKIDMLDFADFVAINKFDRKGAQDALRDVRKQYQRNRELFKAAPDEMPVLRHDRGALQRRRRHRALSGDRGRLARARAGARRPARCRSPRRGTRRSSTRSCRRARVRYLAEIAETVRGYHAAAQAGAHRARAAAASRGEGDAGQDALAAKLDSADRRARRGARARARKSCSTCGRRPRRRMRATSTS